MTSFVTLHYVHTCEILKIDAFSEYGHFGALWHSNSQNFLSCSSVNDSVEFNIGAAHLMLLKVTMITPPEKSFSLGLFHFHSVTDVFLLEIEILALRFHSFTKYRKLCMASTGLQK